MFEFSEFSEHLGKTPLSTSLDSSKYPLSSSELRHGHLNSWILHQFKDVATYSFHGYVKALKTSKHFVILHHWWFSSSGKTWCFHFPFRFSIVSSRAKCLRRRIWVKLVTSFHKQVSFSDWKYPTILGILCRWTWFFSFRYLRARFL